MEPIMYRDPGDETNYDSSKKPWSCECDACNEARKIRPEELGSWRGMRMWIDRAGWFLSTLDYTKVIKENWPNTNIAMEESARQYARNRTKYMNEGIISFD